MWNIFSLPLSRFHISIVQFVWQRNVATHQPAYVKSRETCGKGKGGGEKTLYPVKPWVTRAVEKNESRARGVMGNDVLVSAKLTFFFFFYTKHKQFQTVIREYCQLVCFRNMRKIATQHSQQAGKMRSEFSMTQELPMVSIKGTDGICFSFLASLFELWEHLVCKIRILL